MKQLIDARRYLEESVSLFPCYEGIKELICTLGEIGDRVRIKELLQDLLLLDLTNPTVFNDAMSFAHENHLGAELIDLLQSLSDAQGDETLAKANCIYYAAQLLPSHDINFAKSKLAEARKIFGKLLPPEHQVFKLIRFSIRQRNLAAKKK